MTTARVSRAPVLDRLISVMVSVPAPGATFRYDDERTTQRAVNGDGHWYISSGRLVLWPDDADDTDLPEFSVGDEITMAWDDGAYVVTATLTDVGFASGGFGGQTALPDLEWDASASPVDFTRTTEAMAFSVGGGTAVEPRKVWAGRRDVSVRDELLTTQNIRLIENGSVYTIRNEPPGNGVAVGDTFTDDDGATRRIEGIAQMGRNRYLELLARVG